MKILHVVQRLSLGGLELLALQMVRADLQNNYILAIEGSLEQAFIDLPMLQQCQDNLFFANKKKGFQFQTCDYIKKICQDYSISVIHTHNIGPLIYAGLATLRLNNITHVHTEHDVWHLNQYKDRLFQYLMFKFKKNIHVVSVSQYVFDKLKFYYPDMEITLIRNAVDTDHFKPGEKKVARRLLNLPDNAVIIGSAGRLEEVKGHRFLIEAMQRLPKQYYLAIAGNGSLYQALSDQIQTLQLMDKVEMLGYIENMSLFYQACDVFCLPSLDEGLPMALLEAQACDRPVVCSDVGGCREGVDPDSGLLVPAKNPDELAEACLLVVEKKGEPRQFIERNFSISVLLDQYMQLYKRTLG